MLVFALLLTGCSIAETLLDTTDAPKATPGSAEIVVVSDAGQPLPSATPQTDAALPEDQVENDASSQTETTEPSALTTSPTTGRPLPEGAVYRPILAVIDNAAPSRPQTGLMLADIVYEFPLDRSDHSTRFLAVFSDEIPLKIGPIRTSRAYLANTALEWGACMFRLGIRRKRAWITRF